MKSQNEQSIRKQLLCWLLLPLSALSIVTCGIAYFLASGFANAAYDRELVNSADSVAARLRYDGNKIWLDLPPAAIAVLKHNGKQHLFYQVIKEDGTRIAGDTILKGPFPHLEYEGPILRYDTLSGVPIRIARIKADLPNYPDKEVFVQVAETLDNRQVFAGQILLSIVIPQILLLLCGGFAVSLGVSRGLLPLKVLKDALGVRSQLDLTPLAEDNEPVELKPLVRSINDLLARLKMDLEFQQRFVANAAHQFRTPLAGLKTYIYAAKKLPSNPKMNSLLDQIEAGTDRMTRLSNQLLALAKAEPANKISKYESLDLNLLAAEVCASYVELAVGKGIDLSFEGDTDSAMVEGNPATLEELLRNLLENAILYTQAGGRVIVRLSAQTDNAHICLSVLDNGPGIPAEERDKVFERFYRVLGNEAPGSGLGLAIVKEIATAHDAMVAIDTASQNEGTKVSIIFPLRSVKIAG